MRILCAGLGRSCVECRGVFVLMRCVVCGVGNRLRGDDAVGPVVVDELRKKLSGRDEILFVDCGSAPENFLNKVVGFGARKVIVVDAVAMGAESGTVEVVDVSRIKGFLHSTHQLPLSLFIGYLERSSECEVVFVGVQPESVGFGCELSDVCRKGVLRAVDVVCGLVG